MSRRIWKQFGGRVAQLREQKNLTQLELAKRAGIENAFLSRVERGLKEPCLNTIAALARGLGVPVARLFAGL